VSKNKVPDWIREHNEKVYEEWENRDKTQPYVPFSAPRWREIPYFIPLKNEKTPTKEEKEKCKQRAKELFGDLIPDDEDE